MLHRYCVKKKPALNQLVRGCSCTFMHGTSSRHVKKMRRGDPLLLRTCRALARGKGGTGFDRS
jgi:hypothetical protein